jgi:glycine cleavage system protein P-like pyridoxal-binding family
VTALDMFLKRLKDIQEEVAKSKNEANMASTRQPISATIADDDDTEAKERKERRRAVRRIKPVERSGEEVAQQQHENKETEDEEKKEQDPTAPLDFRAYYQRSKK